MASERITGTVKWFNARQGYGFLTREEGEDVFVHHSAISTPRVRSLQENQEVEFEVTQTERGDEAANVTGVGGAELERRPREGRRSGPRSQRCYNCAQTGHVANDCTEERNTESPICFNCSERGHMSRNCPQREAAE